jgi:hypothetical protein
MDSGKREGVGRYGFQTRRVKKAVRIIGKKEMST